MGNQKIYVLVINQCPLPSCCVLTWPFLGACAWRERQSSGVFSYMGNNPIRRVSLSWLHLNLVTSQRHHLQIPSRWRLGLPQMNLWGDINIHHITRLARLQSFPKVTGEVFRWVKAKVSTYHLPSSPKHILGPPKGAVASPVTPSFLANGLLSRGKGLGEDPFPVSRKTASCPPYPTVPVISPCSGVSVKKQKLRVILKSLNFCLQNMDSLFKNSLISWIR